MSVTKLVIDDIFLEDLINKSWQDIDNIQSQIDNLDTTDIKTNKIQSGFAY